MSDEITNEPTEEAAPAAAETQAEETIAKSAVPEIVKARLAREQKKHEAEKAALVAEIEKLKNKGKKQASTPPKEQPTQMDPAVLERLDRLEAERAADARQAAFDKQLAGRQIPDEQRANMLKAFDPENPSGIEGWIAATVVKQDEQQPPVNASTGAPAGTVPDQSANATQWSRDQIERMKEQGSFRQAADRFFHAGSAGSVFSARKRKG